MGETSKCRERVLKYCQGHGIDIGCGDDKISPEAIGIDSRIQPGVNMVININQISDWFKPGEFDYVFSSHTLEDFTDTETTLDQWVDLIRPGGYLILYLPHRRWYPNIGHPLANKGHKHDFNPEDVLDVLINMGNTELEYCVCYGPPNGIYDYENRGKIEYSFEIVARKI
jgi:SAM-dependent methyltransferase